MGPIEALKLLSLYEKFQSILKKKGDFKMKAAHYILLAASLFGTLGVPSLFTTWLHAHLTVYMIVVAVAVFLHAVAPSIFSAPSDADKKATGLGLVIFALLVFGSARPTFAQTSISNLYAGGVSFNNAAQPAIAGTGLYARLVAGTGTYAFTAVDVLPTSVKPFTVTSNFSAGVAQKVFTIGSVPIFVPSSAGVSFTGTNTGWAWSTGAIAPIKLKGSWRLFPMVRIARSNVSNGSGVQPIIGLLVGWGQ